MKTVSIQFENEEEQATLIQSGKPSRSRRESFLDRLSFSAIIIAIAILGSFLGWVFLTQVN